MMLVKEEEEERARSPNNARVEDMVVDIMGRDIRVKEKESRLRPHASEKHHRDACPMTEAQFLACLLTRLLA